MYRDAGISGSKGRDQRPGFDAMHKDAAAAGSMSSWLVGRSPRPHRLQDLCGFLSELHSLGIDLFLHQQGIDTTTPAGKAMFQMMGVFAEFERSMIRERVNAGIARAKADGKHCGRPFIDTKLEERIREALATPGRPGFTRSPSSSASAAARFNGSRPPARWVAGVDQTAPTASAKSQRGILSWKQQRPPISWRPLRGVSILVSGMNLATMPSTKLVVPMRILCDRFRRSPSHPPNSRSTRLQDGPAFFTARFTAPQPLRGQPLEERSSGAARFVLRGPGGWFCSFFVGVSVSGLGSGGTPTGQNDLWMAAHVSRFALREYFIPHLPPRAPAAACGAWGSRG